MDDDDDIPQIQCELCLRFDSHRYQEYGSNCPKCPHCSEENLILKNLEEGHFDDFEKELDRGNITIESRDKYLTTPLMTVIASEYGTREQVLNLLRRGADVNITCVDNYTPLVFAGMYNKYDIIYDLLDYGADPDYNPDHDTYSSDFLGYISDKQIRYEVEKYLEEKQERCPTFDIKPVKKGL